jgi:hypothetical protein
MKVGDLVKLKHKGNGQPNVGVIYAFVKDQQQRGLDYYQVLWDIPQWSQSLWRKRELVVISEDG